MKILYTNILFLLCLLLSTASFAEKKIVIGWVEKVGIADGSFQIMGKIDSGAENSSLNAPKAKIIKKGTQEWIAFSVVNKKGDVIKLEKQIVRTASIKRKSCKTQDRPVILLRLCLGSVYKEVEVNIVDRNNFKYQLLVGRSFLNKDFVIDTSLMEQTQPSCKGSTDLSLMQNPMQ